MWSSLVWSSRWRSTGARRCCWASLAPTLRPFWLHLVCARSAAASPSGWTARRQRAVSGCGLSNAAAMRPDRRVPRFWRRLRVLAVGLLQRRLGPTDGSEASALLGNHFAGVDRQLRQVRSASRLLRAGRQANTRHTPARSLSIDRDGRQAFNNAIRTATAVSLANGF